MLKVITCNVNGIRSAAKKKLFPWLEETAADIICLQEVRASLEQIEQNNFHLPGYHRFVSPATKAGYSGVAIYSKHEPIKIVNKFGLELATQEGRYLEAHYKKYRIVSLYLPSGSSSEARQEIKYQFLAEYQKTLSTQLISKIPYIICGDFNIAHRKIDLKNWRGNQKHSGFLPEERAWLDHIFDELGWIDTYRYLNPTGEEYTWWSNFGKAWEKNVGWRIDFQIVPPSLANKIKKTTIYREQKFSDHAPFIVEYDL